jgi:hypothetical protein
MTQQNFVVTPPTRGEHVERAAMQRMPGPERTHVINMMDRGYAE